MVHSWITQLALSHNHSLDHSLDHSFNHFLVHCLNGIYSCPVLDPFCAQHSKRGRTEIIVKSKSKQTFQIYILFSFLFIKIKPLLNLFSLLITLHFITFHHFSSLFITFPRHWNSPFSLSFSIHLKRTHIRLYFNRINSLFVSSPHTFVN